MSQAVNEIAQSISTVRRLGDPLRVQPGLGSVRLMLLAPVFDEQHAAMAEQVASIESKAIDVLASLFEQAESDEVDSPRRSSRRICLAGNESIIDE